MSEQHSTGVGLRIAELRKIHGFTQQALAARANVSYSLLRKVERGERSASPSFIAATARALGVSVLDITEQPYGVRDAHPTSEQAGVPALRQALVEGDDPELDTSPRTLDDLRAAVAEIKEFDRRTKHAEVVRALPDVLRHLHRAVLDLPAARVPARTTCSPPRTPMPSLPCTGSGTSIYRIWPTSAPAWRQRMAMTRCEPLSRSGTTH